MVILLLASVLMAAAAACRLGKRSVRRAEGSAPPQPNL